jgi:(p)ppGpp synthase/HD superfamily hydrolase
MVGRGGIRTALLMAKTAHAGMKYNEHDYFDYHIRRVVARVAADPAATYEHIKLAYLHDSVEDTKMTLRVVRIAFGEDMGEAVDAITRRKGEVYKDYIERVGENDMAKLVKIHDLTENLGNSWNTPRETLAPRYEKALKALEG